MFFPNLFSMSGLRGRLVVAIFVIRFFPQNLFGKYVGNLFGNLFGKLLVNGCEIIEGKIAATNPPLRLLTTVTWLATAVST